MYCISAAITIGYSVAHKMYQTDSYLKSYENAMKKYKGAWTSFYTLLSSFCFLFSLLIVFSFYLYNRLQFYSKGGKGSGKICLCFLLIYSLYIHHMLYLLYLLYLHYAFLSQQRRELELRDGKITEFVAPVGLSIEYYVRNVGLYLVIESDIGLTVLWDRKTTVRIILQPWHMVSQKYWTKLNSFFLNEIPQFAI